MASTFDLDDYKSKIKGAAIGIPERARSVPLVGRMAAMRDALGEFSQSMSTRLDSVIANGSTWFNEVTGIGTTRDKSTYGFVLPPRRLSDIELSALYHGDDMAARMVDVVPQETFREGFNVETGDADDDTAVADKLEHLDARGAMGDGARWGRCYGGGAILLGADDGRDANMPLAPERADDLRYLYVLDRRLLWPMTWYTDFGSPKFGKVQTYLVTMYGGPAMSAAEVHESRLVLFGGAKTGIREKIELFGWDYSVYQRAYDILRQFNTGWKAVETMMTDGNQAIFKISGLNEILRAPGGGEEMLRQRLKAMDLYRSVMRAIVVDADGKESFERQNVSFTEIPQTLDKFMLRLAATVEMPVTILMGQSPAGMNATGDSDFRWFYDRIRSKQTIELAPKIRRVAQVWLATKAGREAVKKTPRTLTVKFPPLWTETPLAQAERELAIAQRDHVYVQDQVLQPDEVAIQRFRPEGFSNEIVLTPEGVAAREEALSRDLDALAGKSKDDAPKDAPPDDGVVATAVPSEDDDKPVEVPLAPTAWASVVSINEARASIGLPLLSGSDGKLTISAYQAKNASMIATAAAAVAGEDPDDPKPAPAPAPPFGHPGLPGAPGAPPPPFGHPPDPSGVDPGQRAPGASSSDGEPKPKSPFPPKPGGEEREDAGLRTFVLRRAVDETGVSGTGDVASGCLFADGSVTMKWNTATSSTTIFTSIDDVLKVHGHDGKTTIVWDDEEP